MTTKNGSVTRREFIQDAAGVALGSVVASSLLAETLAAETGASKSKVVLIRDEKVLDEAGKVSAPVIAAMLDRAVAELLGEREPLAAWKKLFKPSDTVGVKSNVWRYLPTPPALEQAIRGRLLDVGVPPERIAVDDRGVLQNPVFQRATALINTRPMRTHHWSGVGSLIKNYIMFSDNPPSWHDDSCANLAGVWKLPHVAGRTRLNVLVMLTPLFHSVGPHDYAAKYTWPYRGLIVGLDPVAVDATGLRVIEAQRRVYFGREEPMATPPKHIRVAAEKHGLGVADPARIDLIRLGTTAGVLI